MRYHNSGIWNVVMEILCIVTPNGFWNSENVPCPDIVVLEQRVAVITLELHSPNLPRPHLGPH
jgi:hypothetical protein